MMHWRLSLILTMGSVVGAYIADSTVYVFSSLEHEVGHFPSCTARFGPEIPDSGVIGKLAYASPADGCGSIERAPQVPSNHTNWVVLIRRNGCNFAQKVYNAQLAGYVAAIIHNVDSDALVPMSGEAGMVKIPSVFVGMTSANELLKYNYSLSDHIQLQLNDYNYTKFLWPFVLVLVIVMSVLIMFTVLKCIVNQIRKCLSRISPSALRKLPIKKYKKGDKYEMCAICLEEYESGEKLRLLPCSHAFHQKCIDPWLTKNKKTCPLCKKKAFSRSGSKSYSESSDSDDERGNRSTERTPLLSSNTSNRTASPNVGIINELTVATSSQPTRLNGSVVDEADLLYDHSSSSQQTHHHVLESSVEVHCASGQDDVDDNSDDEIRSRSLPVLTMATVPNEVGPADRAVSTGIAFVNDGCDDSSASGGATVLCIAAAAAAAAEEPIDLAVAKRRSSNAVA